MPSSKGRSSGRGMGEAATDSQAQRNLIDINVASVEELSTLVGVGRSRAEAIVETRNVCLIITYVITTFNSSDCFSFSVSWWIYIN